MPQAIHIESELIDDKGNVISAGNYKLVAGEGWGIEFTASDVAAMDRPEKDCRVYWGSHGCKLERGHDGPHLCDCADDEGVDPVTREYLDEPGIFNVGAPPYYGPKTTFYGEDATAAERGED